MNYTIPQKIKIISDENILEFVKTIKTKQEVLYQYKFIKSITKLNCVVEFTEGELQKNLSNFFKIIE